MYLSYVISNFYNWKIFVPVSQFVTYLYYKKLTTFYGCMNLIYMKTLISSNGDEVDICGKKTLQSKTSGVASNQFTV